MTCNLKCYGSTGFNAVNIPFNAKELLASSNIPVLYTGVININSLILPSIRIKLDFSIAQYIDYVQMENNSQYYFYTVNALTMLSDNVCELSLMLDGWNTVNDGNEIALDGSVNRMHIKKSDDLYGKFSLEEEFTPSEPLKIEISNKIGQTSNSYINLVVMLQNIKNEDKNKAQVMNPTSSTENDEVLLIPSTSPVDPSYYVMGDSSDYLDNNIGAIFHQNKSSTTKNYIKEQINLLRQYGMENSVIASYNIPTEYAYTIESSDTASTGRLGGVRGLKKNYNAPINLNYANVYNQKVLYGKYSSLKLMSNCSGESIELNPEDVAVGGTVTITITSDPRSTGKPVASFTNYKGKDVSNIFLNSVNGENWANTPIVYLDKSGSAVDRLNFNTNQAVTVENARLRGEQQMISNVAGGAIKGASNSVGGVYGAIAGGVGGALKGAITTAFNQHYEDQILKNTLNAEKDIFTRNLTFTQPNVSFAKSEALRDYVGNSFYIIQNRLSPADIINYDTYLTRYGYNVGNVIFDNSIFNNRKNYIFIKFNDVNIRNNKSIYIRNQAVRQLTNGVRLWKVRPDSAYMTAGGNNE